MEIAIIEVCGDIALAHLLVLVKKFLNIVHLIGPIVALVGLVIHLVKLTFNPENKKYKATIKNWLIAFFMLFLIPTLINAVMMLFDDQFQLAKCWNTAEQVEYAEESITIENEKEKTDITGNYDNLGQ